MNTIWKEIKYHDTVIYYVDVNDPGHVRIYTRLNGKVAWLEFKDGELINPGITGNQQTGRIEACQRIE